MKITSAAKSLPLRVLSLGLDAGPATDAGIGGDTALRLVEYGAHFTEMVVVAKSPKRSDIYQARNLNENVRIIPTLSRGNVSAFFSMVRIGSEILQKQDFDVITVQEPVMCGTAAFWLRRRFGIPIQVQLHGDYLDNRYWIAERQSNHIFNVIGKQVTKRADTVRVVSHVIEDYVINRLGFPAERVFRSPVRVELDVFENADGTRIRSDYAAKGIDRLVLFVGRFCKQKALLTLLRVFAQVIEHCPSARLILIGDGPEREILQHTASSLGLTQKIEFLGWLPLDQVAEYMSASDVHVLPSNYEGLARVLVEASAAGLPSIATERAAPREIITDGETGYRVPNNNSSAIAENIIYLLQHPEVAKQMGKNARELVRVEYDPARLIGLNIESLRLTAELGLR